MSFISELKRRKVICMFGSYMVDVFKFSWR